jgi:hypothetical protein
MRSIVRPATRKKIVACAGNRLVNRSPFVLGRNPGTAFEAMAA